MPIYKKYASTLCPNDQISFSSKALFNRRNFLHYLIAPFLGAFYNDEKKFFFFYIEQASSQ